MCNLKKKKNQNLNVIKTGTVTSQSCIPYKDTHKDTYNDKVIVQWIDSEPIYNGRSKQNKKAYSMTTKIKIKLKLRVLERNIFQRVNKWKLQIFLFFIYILF